MQDLARMAVFAVVAEQLSLSKAAEKLNCSKSAVSKQITALENQLGIKLLYRSARRSRLTDEGEVLAVHCQGILRQYHEALDLSEQLKATPAGKLLLEVPDNLATHVVLPRIGEFHRQQPLINLNLRLRQASLQTLSEDLDVAVVSGELPESSLICRRLGEQQLGLYASPSYLERHDAPNTLEDLADHQCIVTVSDFIRDPSTWMFYAGDELCRINVQSAISVNDMAAVEQLVLDGLGISPLQNFAVAEQVSQGSLIPLLTNFAIPPVPVYALFPERKHLSPKIRVMVDFLCECFEAAGLAR